MRLKQLFLLAGLALLLATCSRDALDTTASATPATERLSKEAINAFVLSKLESEGRFTWDMGDNHLVWSAIAHGQHTAGIGYQPVGFTNIKDRIHEIDISEPAWRNVRDDLMATILSETQRLLPGQTWTLEDLLVGPEEKTLPSFMIRIMHPDLVDLLTARPDVRYVEPLDYSMEEVADRSDSGCGVSPASSIPSADFTNTSPNVKIPWNFYNMNIPAAWSYSRGDNIGVCVIDTGTSPNQPKLGSQFATGQSANRYINRYGTYVSSWWWWASPDGPNDDCGHGTQMAGLVAAPRAYDGTSVGVAYQANLVTVRATGDVVINGSSEKNGVQDALVIAGNRSDVRIISMSIGDVFWSNTVADGIYYAYNRGKLIFAAAGTSLSWTSWYGVIFPANMAETVAVTGVKDGFPLQKCNTCHDGNAVDFVAVMQRRNDNSRTSLTLAMSGNTPAYVGGSSAATATTAGIAALVWATNPSQSRSQVLQRLKNAASIYPGRDGNFGWGIIDAHYAVTH
jgi:hypothetical protein